MRLAADPPGRADGGVTQYDDGVYLGAAIRFVSGVLPYRDFVFVQPPGIVVLMSPVALLGRADRFAPTHLFWRAS